MPGCSPFNVFAICKSLSIFYASMSGERKGGVGLWNRVEVVGTSAVRSPGQPNIEYDTSKRLLGLNGEGRPTSSSHHSGEAPLNFQLSMLLSLLLSFAITATTLAHLHPRVGQRRRGWESLSGGHVRLTHKASIAFVGIGRKNLSYSTDRDDV